MAQLTITPGTSNLGTITNDIQYTVTSDTSGTLVANIEVTGVLFNTQTLTSGTSSVIYVTQLPTGTNTIVLTATLTESGGTTTSASATWTYTKTLINIPTSGNVSNLLVNGQPTFPTTLAEAIKVSPALGNTLDKTLNLLSNSVTYTATAVPKYSQVTVNLSTAQVGDIVNLPYNGVMVPHIVVQIGNPNASMYDSSCDGVWLLRHDCVENGQWNSTNVNTLSGSAIMTTMQGYVSQYDSTVSSQIQTVKIPYCTGGGNTTINTLANGLQCQMFPLSGYEVGWTTSTNQYFPVDGAVLSYFQGTASTDSKRIAYYNGSATDWWLRSPRTNNDTNIWFVGSSGSYLNSYYSYSYGYRPCFILPSTFSATYYVDSFGGVHAEQEYSTAGDFYDLWGNIIPTVKIETGSYVGTGTYGADNPTVLTFPFKPKIVRFYCYENDNSGKYYQINLTISLDLLINSQSYNWDFSTTSATIGSIVWDDESMQLRFYGSSDYAQCNRLGTKYFYYYAG